MQGFAPRELVSRGQQIFRGGGGGIRLVYNLPRISFQACMSGITLASVYIYWVCRGAMNETLTRLFLTRDAFVELEGA